MARRLGRLGERVFGPAEEPGGPGAGMQLWWDGVGSAGSAGSVVAASAVLEVLEAPILGRRYAWGLQAGVVDGAGRRVGVVVDSIVRSSGGEWERSSAAACAGSDPAAGPGPRWSLSLAAVPPGVGLVDLAVWMDLAEPPDDPPVVARWWSLSCRLASGSSVAVERVRVTFPQGSTWRRLDVVVDEIGVLQVSNTARTAANMSVLALPPDR